MILLDTNVLIDARDKGSAFHQWAEEIIAGGLAGEGIAINAIILAELCVGQENPTALEMELRAHGFALLDVPAAASAFCARAYSRYRLARKKSRGGDAPHTPLPDFFIGAHAELLNWKVATRDPERFQLYFANVDLLQPPRK